MRTAILAFIIDVVTLAVIALLAWQHSIPGELVAGLMGAVIGARAREHSDHHDGNGSGQPRRGHLRPPPALEGNDDRLARDVLDASAIGPFVRVML